jgi:hypothetical protein
VVQNRWHVKYLKYQQHTNLQTILCRETGVYRSSDVYLTRNDFVTQILNMGTLSHPSIFGFGPYQTTKSNELEQDVSQPERGSEQSNPEACSWTPVWRGDHQYHMPDHPTVFRE